jgi:hypothetical protein
MARAERMFTNSIRAATSRRWRRLPRPSVVSATSFHRFRSWRESPLMDRAISTSAIFKESSGRWHRTAATKDLRETAIARQSEATVVPLSRLRSAQRSVWRSIRAAICYSPPARFERFRPASSRRSRARRQRPSPVMADRPHKRCYRPSSTLSATATETFLSPTCRPAASTRFP